MKLLQVETLEGAREKLFAHARLLPLGTELAPVFASAGRVLAEDIYTPCNIPPFRRSSVDGYAVVAADTAGAGEGMPVFLCALAPVEMGKPFPQAIKAGECAYVPTGGMLPDGADAMVMVEHSEVFGPDSVALYDAVSPGRNMVEAGEDARAGSLLLPRGACLRPQEIGALAAAGVVEAPLRKKLRLTIISTGDELVPPQTAPRPGEIRDINTEALRALAERSGYAVVSTHVLRDDAGLMEQTVRAAMAQSDMIIISGGSSQGRKDLTGAVIEATARPGLLFHGLAIKPGKPTLLGYDEASATLLVGLPGHPAAALMVFETLLGNLAERLLLRAPRLPVPARMACNLPGNPGQTTCQMVQLQAEEAETSGGPDRAKNPETSGGPENSGGPETSGSPGRAKNPGYLATPIFGKSGLITTLARADGYIVIDMNKEGLRKGEEVLAHLF